MQFTTFFFVLAALSSLVSAYPYLPLPTWEIQARQSWTKVAYGHVVPGPYGLPPTTTTPPTPTSLIAKRQVPGPVWIPYKAQDWTTYTTCPSIFGVPCAIVTAYLPHVAIDSSKVKEEAARITSLINSGAYVPGANVSGSGATALDIGVLWVFAALGGVAVFFGLM